MKRNKDSNIVSTTQEEAGDKLETGNLLYSSIPDNEELAKYGLDGFKPPRWKQAQEELAFHMPPYTSSVVSKPGTSAIRGGKKDMYYDEAAFIKEFPKLWQAGLPAIIRGDGRVTVVSTPYGQSGLFYELWNEADWSHHEVPWWHSRFMVKGGTEEAVMEAIAFAPEMQTEQRLERFGSEKLLKLFRVGLRGNLIAFKTEFECQFIDELEAYFPYDSIMENVSDLISVRKTWNSDYHTDNMLTMGVDIAKKIDKTVVTVVEHAPNKKRILFMQELHDDYTEQFDVLAKLVKVIQPSRISLDETGPGVGFVERVKRGELGINIPRIEAVNFTNEKKEKWATTFKGDLQTNAVEFPRHSEFIAQTHGIRRKATENGRFKFSGEPHDDYFWSAMLALYGEDRLPVRFYSL